MLHFKGDARIWYIERAHDFRFTTCTNIPPESGIISLERWDLMSKTIGKIILTQTENILSLAECSYQGILHCAVPSFAVCSRTECLYLRHFTIVLVFFLRIFFPQNLEAHGISGVGEGFSEEYVCRFCSRYFSDFQTKQVLSGEFCFRSKDRHK